MRNGSKTGRLLILVDFSFCCSFRTTTRGYDRENGRWTQVTTQTRLFCSCCLAESLACLSCLSCHVVSYCRRLCRVGCRLLVGSPFRVLPCGDGYGAVREALRTLRPKLRIRLTRTDLLRRIVCARLVCSWRARWIFDFEGRSTWMDSRTQVDDCRGKLCACHVGDGSSRISRTIK